jgi:uncharacterized protein YchJ
VALSKDFLDQVTKLKESYSKENELSHLLKFAAAVDNIMKRNQFVSETVSNEKSRLVGSAYEPITSSITASTSIRRNELCPCGSGKKFKHCHGAC